MVGLNADAEWAIERWENLDPAKSQWDADTVVTAVRRHLIALGWPELDFIVVAHTPSAATELITAGNCLSGRYRDLTRRLIHAELDTAGAETADAFNAGVDRVFLHPHFEALMAISGGWEQFARGGDLFPALFEVAAGIGARAAELSPELVWVWDQIQVAFEAGLGWYALIDDGLVVLPRPLLTMPAGRLHRIDGFAVQWPDGSGLHFIEGVEFDHDLHHRLVHRIITAEEALSCEFGQRLLAMAAAPPQDLLALMEATLLNTGAKGTRLYRVDSQFGIDRPDYCITMTDPSTGRCYLEWIEPEVGEQQDAELCQAHLFDIDLADWLSVTAEA